MCDVQEANRLFGGINEALLKLEANKSRGQPDSALKLLRADLGVQGEALSDSILDLCTSIRSDSTPASLKDDDGERQVRSLVSASQKAATRDEELITSSVLGAGERAAK